MLRNEVRFDNSSSTVRCRPTFGAHETTCVGTFATMASGGTNDDQKRGVAKVAQSLPIKDATMSNVCKKVILRACTREQRCPRARAVT